MTPSASSADAIWGRSERFATVARNLITRYLVIFTDASIGLLVLPFNVHHLGPSQWGLWMLMTSLNTYFSVLDLGYGGSITRFVAFYRAKRDLKSLNEILSTLFTLFAAVGVVAYLGFVVVSFHITSIFNIEPDQVHTGRMVLLITGMFVSLGFPFSVYGGLINGFQRYDINNMVGIATSIVAAIVNVAMLLAGCSLVQLVTATTAVRVTAFLLYRRNAYRVFPALSIRPVHFRWSRLKEVTGFSIYVSVMDWSSKLNYSIDALVIGAYLSPAAVALWTVPQRIAEFLQRLTNQLNGVLFPVIVDSHAAERPDHLRVIFVQGTRLSLFLVVPLGAAIFMLAGPLIRSWVGPQFEASIRIVQILVTVIAIRVGGATATILLKGAGRHRLLAFANAGSAIVNLALSLWWVRRYGLIGQALGTLFPVSAVCIFVVWPAACRRVGISIPEAFRIAVWPALWPIAVTAATILTVRRAVPPNLFGVAVASAAGALAYALVFFTLAIPRAERDLYAEKIRELLRRYSGIAAAA
ncbi:MAG TPA: oligosaccharide flippase family protein [Vicinamibacterales bacterium]